MRNLWSEPSPYAAEPQAPGTSSGQVRPTHAPTHDRLLKRLAQALLVGIAVAVPAESVAQRNAAYVELLGNGGVGSLNYERTLVRGVGLRGGLSYIPEIEETLAPSYGFPLMAVLTSKGRRGAEINLGVVFRYRTNERWGPQRWTSAFYTATFGYRQVSEAGTVFRIGFTPIYGHAENNPTSGGWVPWVGISVGPTF